MNIARVTEAEMRDAFNAVDGPDVDALVQVGTNLACAKVAAHGEFWLNKPVIAINTATYWYALRQNGIMDQDRGLRLAAGRPLDVDAPANEHLESLRDGRTIYIGNEKITDVTTHPAFRNTAQTVAMLYDIKADPANREIAAFEEDGELYSIYFLKPKTRDDLARRTKMHKFWGDASYGLFGRSGDHVAGWVTALAMQPEVMPKPEFGRNITAYYEHMRKNDTFLVYAVLPPQAARDPEFYARENVAVPDAARDRRRRQRRDAQRHEDARHERRVRQRNLDRQRAAAGARRKSKSRSPARSRSRRPGVTLWSRKSFEREAQSTFDNPLSSRFDETDSMVLFDNVKVPWERVFVHDDAAASREIYHKSAAHRFGNHQSNVRFLSKLQLLLGIASKVTISNNAREIPAVKEVLGKLAAMEGMLAGMIAGQCMDYDDLGNGYVSFNRRYMYAGLQWCTDNYNEITAIVRELCGGGVFQMPADVSVMDDPDLAKTFEQYWRAPAQTRARAHEALQARLGSARLGIRRPPSCSTRSSTRGRRFLVRNYNYQWAPWDALRCDRRRSHGAIRRSRCRRRGERPLRAWSATDVDPDDARLSRKARGGRQTASASPKNVDRAWEPGALAKWMFQALPENDRFGLHFEQRERQRDAARARRARLLDGSLRDRPRRRARRDQRARAQRAAAR